MSIWTSLTELKTVLQIDLGDTSEDRLLNIYSESAEAIITKYLNGGVVFRAERTEYYDGTGTDTIVLRSLPVQLEPAPRLWLDERGFYGREPEAFGPLTELNYGTDFVLQVKEDGQPVGSGRLFRLKDAWPRPMVRQRGFLSPFIGDSRGPIKVLYTGGHTADTLPADIRLAVAQTVARIRDQFPFGMPLASESYEDRSISRFNSTLDKFYLLGQVKYLLAPYRRWRF